MYIETCKSRGQTYLRLVRNIKKQNAAGVWKDNKEIVLSLGRLDQYDDGRPDYLKRLRESFRQGRPLIAKLQPYVGPDPGPEVIRIPFRPGTSDCVLTRKWFASTLLDPYFDALGLSKLLVKIGGTSGAALDLSGLTKLMTYGRLLDPRSKLATTEQNRCYYEPPVSDLSFNPKSIYRALDLLHANRSRILETVNSAVDKYMQRNTRALFFDVTNVFFQIDEPDQDETDGEIIVREGLRKRGYSKEGRRKPVVQVALFMDSAGLPVTVLEFPGNTPDVSTVETALSEMLPVVSFDQFIFVADRGICSMGNCAFIQQCGYGYVISKSIRKSGKAIQNWILEEVGWTELGPDFKFKSHVRTETVDSSVQGETEELTFKEIVFWSRKYYKKELAEHQQVVEFLEQMQDVNGYIPLDRLQKTYVKKNFKKVVAVRGKDGEPSDQQIKKKDLLEMIDVEKLERDVALLGYYLIVTSELEMPDREVIATYKSLVEIEDEFKEMKSHLEIRPVFVRTPEHISAHILTCFLALLMLRLIQLRIVEHNPQLRESDLQWTWGLSGERVQNALRDWQIAELPGEHFAFTELDHTGMNADLALIRDSFGIEAPKTLYTRRMLGIMKHKIKPFS